MATIEQIEGEEWPDPGPDASTLVRRCTELRRKELYELTTGDLRIMLGQQVAVPVLLPMAVRVLLETPIAEGDYRPGELLHAVVRLPIIAWQEMRSPRDRLSSVIATVIDDEELPSDVRAEARRFLGQPTTS